MCQKPVRIPVEGEARFAVSSVFDGRNETESQEAGPEVPSGEADFPMDQRTPGLRARDLTVLYGEFDPGSGRTLAACLTHASRAGTSSGVTLERGERRTGE